MLLKIYSSYFVILSLVLISCKSEPIKIADDSAVRNAIVDSTITAFQKKLLAQQIDSVFSKTKFNGSISVVKDGEKLYEKENGFEDSKGADTPAVEGSEAVMSESDYPQSKKKL